MMVRRGLLLLGLVLALTCGPTAIPAPSESPSVSSAPIASGDLITLREGGQQSSLAVRKVATSEVVRSMPDGLLMPDGVTLVTVDGGGTSTLVKKIDRRTGATSASRTIEGTWQLYRGYPSFTGASADGTHVVLFGSSYNFTDASGAWTARTTLGVLDLATWKIDPTELIGRYSFQAVSNDGRLVYLVDYTSQPSKPRVYDVTTRALGDVQGDALPSSDFMVATYAGGFAFQLFSSTESVQIRPDMIQVTPTAKLARIDLASRSVRWVRLPIERALTGEEPLMWSFAPTADGRTLYLVNPAAGSVIEIDVASLQVRRTGHLTASDPGALALLLAASHPVAYAKMGYGTGAALSPDGSTLYVLGATGIWAVATASLDVRTLTRQGAYETMRVSPDGKRLYVLGRGDGIVSAIDTQSGAVLGAMKRIAFPSDIVAVDAG